MTAPVYVPIPVYKNIVRWAVQADRHGDDAALVCGAWAHRAYNHHGETGADNDIAEQAGRDPSTIENRRHAYEMYITIREQYGVNSARTLRRALTYSHLASAWGFWNAGWSVNSVYENLYQMVDRKVEGLVGGQKEPWSVAAFEKEMEPNIIGGGSITKAMGMIKHALKSIEKYMQIEINSYGKTSLSPAVVAWLEAAPKEVRG